MHLLDENNQLVGRTWYFIRDTSGVIGFAGTKDKPIPMRQSEVDSMLAQMKEREEKVKPKVSFEVGESVKVADGPFQNQTGIVEEIDPERGKLRVSVTFSACNPGRTRILASRTRLNFSDRINQMIRMISEIFLLTYFVNSVHSV